MLRFFFAMLALSAILAGMQYAARHKPWIHVSREEPAEPTTVELPAAASADTPRRFEVRLVPVTREVVRRDCSGRVYVCRETEYQPVRVVRGQY